MFDVRPTNRHVRDGLSVEGEEGETFGVKRLGIGSIGMYRSKDHVVQ